MDKEYNDNNMKETETNNRISYQEFADKIIRALEDFYGKDADVGLTSASKINVGKKKTD